MAGNDDIPLGYHVHGISADGNDPAPSLEKHRAAHRLFHHVGPDFDGDKALESARFRSGGLRVADSPLLCDELGVHDIDRNLEDWIEKAFQRHPCYEPSIGSQLGEFPAVSKLYPFHPSIHQLHEEPCHLLSEGCKRLDGISDLGRDDWCVHNILCRTSFQDGTALLCD